jgi:hypothetical protein
MFPGARSPQLSLTGREQSLLNQRPGTWHIQEAPACALKITLCFSVPRPHNCCMELTFSSKRCISKFLSKGLFFYYLLNFQTISNFGGKTRKHGRNCQQWPLAVVCVMKWFFEWGVLLFNWLSSHCSNLQNGKMKTSFPLICLHHFMETYLYSYCSILSLCLTEVGEGWRNPRCFQRNWMFL